MPVSPKSVAVLLINKKTHKSIANRFELKHNPEAAASRIHAAKAAVDQKPMVTGDGATGDEIRGDQIEVKLSQPKWGITTRLTGGPLQITKVAAGKEGESVGLKVGDIIVQVNEFTAKDQRDEAIATLRKGGAVTLKVVHVSGNVGQGWMGGIAAADQAVAKSAVVPEMQQMAAMVGSANAVDTHAVNGKREDGVVADGTFHANTTLIFHDCHNCTYTIANYAIKVYVQDCTNFKVVFDGKVLTQTVEVFKCEKLSLVFNTVIGTLQADQIDGLELNYTTRANFGMVVWAGCEGLNLTFDDEPASNFSTSYSQMSEGNGTVNKERSQWRISNVDGKVTQEALIRLENGFTTTEREKKVFDDNQELAIKAMADKMGITVGKKKKEVKVGPNDPCPCGLGKKTKKCCPEKYLF